MAPGGALCRSRGELYDFASGRLPWRRTLCAVTWSPRCTILSSVSAHRACTDLVRPIFAHLPIRASATSAWTNTCCVSAVLEWFSSSRARALQELMDVISSITPAQVIQGGSFGWCVWHPRPHATCSSPTPRGACAGGDLRAAAGRAGARRCPYSAPHRSPLAWQCKRLASAACSKQTHVASTRQASHSSAWELPLRRITMPWDCSPRIPWDTRPVDRDCLNCA